MMLGFVLSISLSVCFCDIATAVSQGTIRLYRNGVADTSQSWSSGIVQIYYNGRWGNICYDSLFGPNVADVICHQLGYTGASSYSNTGLKTTWGVDTSATIIDGVSCISYSYIAITQCSFDDSFISSSCDNRHDVTVTCDTDRIWDFITVDGDIRLTGGTYSNQGLLEVYCNHKWGTVCDDHFGAIQARVACRQLGYNNYTDYDHLSQRGTSSEKIFLRSLSGCTASSDCLTLCGGCPSSGISSCSHDEDVTLECSYSSSYSKVSTESTDSCIYYDFSRDYTVSLIGSIIGGVILFIVCVCISICIGTCIRLSRVRGRSRGPLYRSAIVSQEPPVAAVNTQPAQQPYYPSAGYPPPPTQQTPSGYYPTQSFPNVGNAGQPMQTAGGYSQIPQEEPVDQGFPQEQNLIDVEPSDP